VDVGVDAAGGDDLALGGDDLRARADGDDHAGLDVRVAGLADGVDAAALDADVGLHDSPVIDDDGVGDDRVHRAFTVGSLPLAHAVADHLAAAELDLLAIEGGVALDLDDQVGVGQSHAVADRGPEHVGVGGSGNAIGHQALPSSGPITSPRTPMSTRAPAIGTKCAPRVWPGSKRMAAPAGMSSRWP